MITILLMRCSHDSVHIAAENLFLSVQVPVSCEEWGFPPESQRFALRDFFEKNSGITHIIYETGLYKMFDWVYYIDV